ncbi:unnamed protein product [Echinostoma caproni]|uniref:Protein-serine/threonine phosphatase n=1 Tax=Echinostoma caproni TaxID=27848 RepID=A0A183AH98_9TREM|nr:unnamed protein product [Echinostoma caproni]
MDCSNLLEDGGTATHENSAIVQMGDGGNNLAVAYRTIASSPYLMLSGARLSPTLTGDSYTNEVAHAHWATVSPGYMSLTEAVGQTPSFGVHSSSNSCPSNMPPGSLYYQSGRTTSSKLDELSTPNGSGSGYDDQRFYRVMHHPSLPDRDLHGPRPGCPEVDKTVSRRKKSNRTQSDQLDVDQTNRGNPMSTFNTLQTDCPKSCGETVSMSDNSGSKVTDESSAKSPGLTDAQKSHGDSVSTEGANAPWLLYMDNRQSHSATAAAAAAAVTAAQSRSHLTGGSFV